jgi:hypothetical protein
MNKFDHQLINEKVRNALSKLKGIEFHGPKELAEFLKKEDVHFSSQDLIVFGHTLATRFGRSGGTFHVPDWLAGVFSALIEGVSPKTICDPWAGIGLLLGVLREASRPKEAFAFTPNQGEHALGKVLVPEADWQVGDPLHLLGAVNKELDVVASILPMGARSTNPLKVTLLSGDTAELSDDLGNLVMVAASMRLSSSGVGLFVVTPSFFFSQRSVFRQFGDLGLGVEAALALPPGTFAPYTNIPAYLVIVHRKPSTRMFVAQLSADANTNLQIIGNFRQDREGGSLELGRFVVPQSFRNIETIRTEERVALAERRFGAPSMKLEDIATVINLGRFGDDFAFNPLENTIFIPLIGNSDVMESLGDLTLKKQNYAQVVIDPARSNARFVARFLNSEFGKELREQSKSGTFIPKLNKQTLKELRVFVPDLTTQKRMLEIEARIATEHNTVLALQNELAELRRELWANPNTATNVEQRLSGLAIRLAGGIKQHATESLDQWFETLPFPLASILRAWQATPSQDFKTKHEHLLHFFEGTAEFLGVILLSAFSSNEAIFESHKHKLTNAMQKQNLSFQRATFGTWKLVVEYLGKQIRELLSENGKKPDDAKNDRALCADIFSDPSLSLPQALSRKDLAGILSTTNKMRNDWGGHGGMVGQGDAQLRNEQLLGEVLKLREAVADTWAETQLIHALHSRLRSGVYENEVSILMSSNSEFLKESRAMSICLDVERLYLAKKDSERALKLLPLVQVGPSPHSAKNACYFFNRLERDGARFISYHFTDKPELTGQFADAAETIKFLTQA